MLYENYFFVFILMLLSFLLVFFKNLSMSKIPFVVDILNLMLYK